jgi:hypothetical protein
MEPNSDRETLESKATEKLDDRRAFLKRAAIGVAGAAGLVALGASSARADDSVKSRILERIKAQMDHDALATGSETSGTTIYLKAPDWP